MSGWLMNAKHIPSSFGWNIDCEGPTLAVQRQAGGPGATSRSVVLRDVIRLRDYGKTLLRRKSTSVAAW